ncbi:MAG: hypothetical protein A2Y17_00530 [Clostridiales bacterium GWF2_38_85]|nr:MAG: hypothetical protein A2Y17_00530 [Clostridiales bacterium GWF2_38_85]
MLEIQKLPEVVRLHLEEKGVDLGKAVFTLKTDFGRDAVYKDVFITLTEDKLYILEGSQVVTDKTGGTFKESTFDEYLLEKLEEPRAELFISSGVIVAKYDGEETPLFHFSNTYRHDANVFCSLFEEYKKDKKIDEEKIKKEKSEEKECPKCHMRYPDPNRKICPKCMDKASLIKRLGGFFLKYKLYIIIMLITFAFVSGVSVLVPYVSNRMFYDEVLAEGGKYYGMIGMIIALIIGVRLLNMGVSMVNGILSSKISARVVYDLKKTIFTAIQRLSLGFFTNRQTGGLMTQVNNDATTIYWFFCDGFPYLVTNILQLTAVLVLMLFVNPLLTLYTFVTIPAFIILYRLVFRLFGKLWSRSYSRNRSFNSLISDVLTGVRVVKSFSREGDEVERFEKRNTAAADANLKIHVTANKTFPLIGLLLRVGSYLVWGIGGWQVIQGQGDMTYGKLMQFVAYMAMVYGPIDFLADVSNWWAACLNALHRLFEISDATPEVIENENPTELEKVKGEIEFKNVSFSYEENRLVIDDISFSVPAGTTLGIVGHTGAGKSTLANLLTRLYDPTKGSIVIDGVDIKDLSFSTLRNHIAIVSQETYLFRGSIMDNIRYACPEATYEEVINAAKIASAHDYIIKYPDGYNTMIGWGYKELSGGERQRVSIARAVLKNPSILILDEATAAMDTQTERQIQAALNALTRNRTTIIIAHRLSTLKDADNLIVIENGKMPESGTPRELLIKKGEYYKLYKLQAEALKTIGIEE